MDPRRAPTADPLSTAEDLGRYVLDSPSSFHAAHAAAARLEEAGFTRLDETVDWSRTGVRGRRYVLRDGALIAWATPADVTPAAGFRILGAHTDSPGFKLKPRPTTTAHGWYQAGVEVYGGPLLNSWLDRELRLAGRLVLRGDDGAPVERLTATGPVARIPQLAIHLDREANKGLQLDRQQHVQPIWGVGRPEDADVLALLAEHAAGGPVDPARVLGYDVVLADAQPPAVFGHGGTLLASGRLDNLSSVHAGLSALLREAGAVEAGRHIAVLAAFDHEEIGSGTRSGAAGPFLEDVLVRVADGLGRTAAEHRRALAGSVCLSADAGHLVHPNYQGHHDPVNRPVPGAGPLLKINADQRYATDAVGAGIWAEACGRAGVGYQEFVSNNRVPCGSTIGPLTAARLGIRTIDVGIGLLSMHSARELCHVDDVAALGAVAGAFFTG
ncbi:M18 family aminopeptidase [Kocuria sp. CNJ-770]|uniref:M18 family aminopeptidase n=1 Tax=Kocuria oceani TaxID=988827 RepID=A0ABV9TL37_9MICC|nr:MULTISPECIES: M18 family aminopeptidase [Kocuria]OLT11651.1 M18 family aminopeptidase [Kocuria sp. CNJ-770]